MSNSTVTANDFRSGRQTGMNMSRVVEPELFAESRRIRLIRNNITGNEEIRHIGDKMRWELVCKHALKNPGEFTIEYDDPKELKTEEQLISEDGVVKFAEAELMEMNMPTLRKIAEPMGVTGRSKAEIIVAIRKAQGTLR